MLLLHSVPVEAPKFFSLTPNFSKTLRSIIAGLPLILKYFIQTILLSQILDTFSQDRKLTNKVINVNFFNVF
ncbi:hypothetical protein DRI50_11495 [candidate division KSB1 bacterium]|nr:MAG: hypothetical protein DRI50_11495 [candidate division KSB1 bacterium]